MKTTIVAHLILILFLVNQTHAQDTTANKRKGYTVTLKKITIGSINGFEFEKRIASKSTLSFSAGAGLFFLNDDLEYNLNGEIGLFPVISSNYRYYYNSTQRANLNKNVSNNCADYLVGRIDVVLFKSSGYTNNYLISQGWGLQRSLAKNIFFNLQLGITENIFKYNSNIEVRLQPLFNGTIFFKL